MAFNSTTLSAAITNKDKSILVASATGFAAGNYVLIGRELCRVSKEYVSGTTIPLDQRGIDGAQVAHVTSELVTVGLASDFSAAVPGGAGGNVYPAAPGMDIAYYSAAGAIALPVGGRNMMAVILGTGALAMTLASPTRDMEGCLLFITNTGKAAHTVTLTAGFGANTTSSDVVTWNAAQSGALLAIAAGGVWNLVGIVAGAATVAGPGLA